MLRFHFSILGLVLVSIEKIYQILKTVFDQISKLELSSKNISLGVVLSTLLAMKANAGK